MTDLALARRLAAGEDAAFEEFFAEYFPRLFRFASARLGGAEDAAKEVVQMAMVKALTKITTYRGEAAMFTWLCTFCRHEIAAWFARGGHASAVALVEDRPDARGAFESLARIDEGDPDAALRRREVSRLVQATLDHLPARYADVLEWKYILGLSVDEIAGRLGLSGKAAESLLTRARQAFRDGFSTVAGGWPT